MKFKIKDEDNRIYEVEEIEDKVAEEKAEEIVEEETAKDTLSAEEISALKGLAAIAPKLMKLLEVEDKEHEAVEDEDIEEDIDEDIEKEKEEVVDTMKGHDSKQSFGSIEKKIKVDDSSVDTQLEIADAWAKRYGGK